MMVEGPGFPAEDANMQARNLEQTTPIVEVVPENRPKLLLTSLLQ